MNKVEMFINEMKSFGPEYVTFLFYRGYCYWFAFILSERFKGEIWFNPHMVHFACKIDEELYDIYGKIDKGRNPITGEYDELDDCWISWEEYQYNNHESVESIVQSCIKKV